MTTRAEQFKSEQQRKKAPRAKKVVKAARRVRTAAAAKTKKETQPRSVTGSERAQRMKGATAEVRHGRRSG